MLKSNISENLDPAVLRNVAGAFATGVTVITVEHRDQILGMTANSFVSISLSPPLVMFSVRNQAHILDAISTGKSIGINILQESQKELSDHFAGNTNIEVKPIFQTINNAKILNGSLAYYCCTVDKIIECGDHQLILCAIKKCQRNEGKPLLYYSGYATLGDTI